MLTHGEQVNEVSDSGGHLPARRARAITLSQRETQSQRVALSFFQPIPSWVSGGATLMAAWAMFTPNFALTAACAALVPVLVGLLWFRGQPPVLVASCCMQWLQICTPVLSANLNGDPMTAYGVAEIERATWLSLAGLVFLAIGIRFALVRAPMGSSVMEEEVRQMPAQRLFQAWVLGFAISYVSNLVGWQFGSLAQFFHALTGIKWLFFFFLAYRAFVCQEGYGLLFLAVAVEFITGILGFFAGFKEVFFMLLLAAATPRLVLSAKSRIILAVSIVFLLCASLVWTAIKMDYRASLNQGTGEQTVTVPVEVRLAVLDALVSNLTWRDIVDGIQPLADRISYTEYFAHTLAYVPESVPYEHGKLWLGAITHIVKPRFLFPAKDVLNDSERTAVYTGLAIAGSADSESGTSIGLGYMAESYIDFGPVGMFVPIFLVGLLFGGIYRFFAFGGSSPLLGSAIATAALFPLMQAFEVSNIKLLGGTVTRVLVLFVISRVFSATVLNWLRGTRTSARIVAPKGSAR